MSGVGAGSPRGRVRLLGGRLVRWMYKSGHREMLTRELEPTVAALRGVVLDVGGGRDSPLAGAWTDAARRVRIDVVLAERPIIQADACRLPVRSGSVDAVLISEVLEHVADPEAAFTEIHRVLRPGGELAGSVPFLCQGLHADPHDFYRYTDAALARFLAEFEDVDIRPHGNGFGVAWRMVFTSWRFLLPLNPLLRKVGRRTNPMTPEGYVFRARRPFGP